MKGQLQNLLFLTKAPITTLFSQLVRETDCNTLDLELNVTLFYGHKNTE